MPGLPGVTKEDSGVFDLGGPANAGGGAISSRPINSANLKEVPAQLF